MVQKAHQLNLPGEVTISFPKGPKGVYSISNSYHKGLSLQQKLHYSPYTGELLLHQQWKDVGVLMHGRMWVMAFHQGQFGNWNWWLMLVVSTMLFVTTFAALISYFSKKEKGKWILPNVPKRFVVSKFVVFIIILLGLLFPLFGVSALLIYGFEKFKKRQLIKSKKPLQ